MEAWGPDPGPEPILPARGRVIPGRNTPWAQVIGKHGKAPSPGTWGDFHDLQASGGDGILIRETAGYIEDAQRLADEENP